MSIADRKKRETEKRQEDILQAAEKLFISGDYDSITMNAIAEEAEVNKALLYYYFNDKLTLFISVVTRVNQILLQMVREAEAREITGLEKITAIGRAYYLFAHQYPDYYRIGWFFRSRRFDLDFLSGSEVMQKYQENGDQIFTLSCQSIELGIKDGSIRPDVDPVEVYITLSWMADSIPSINPKLISILKERGISKDKFVEDIWKLQRRMIENPENRR